MDEEDVVCLTLTALQYVSVGAHGIEFKPPVGRFSPSQLATFRRYMADKTSVQVQVPATSPYLTAKNRDTDDAHEHGFFLSERSVITEVGVGHVTLTYDRMVIQDVEFGAKSPRAKRRAIPVVPAVAAGGSGGSGSGKAQVIRGRTDKFSTKVVYSKDGHGIRMDSKLEAKHARLLDIAELDWEYYRDSDHCLVKYQMGSDDSGHYYTPDFYVSNVPTSVPSDSPDKPVYRDLILEIKPQYPDAEALTKCEITSKVFPEALVIMFAGEMKHGFVATDRERTYDHVDGLRGIAWLGGTRLGGDAGYYLTNRGQLMVLVESVPRYLVFPSEKLHTAYAQAASFGRI